MISLLKAKGYKFTKKTTLNNREFRASRKAFSMNEEDSSFEKRAYDLTEDFELFLDTKTYTLAKMVAIIDASRGESIDNFEFEVIEEERGFFITFTVIKTGVK